MRYLSPMSGWEERLRDLRASGGKRFWRGLDELLDTPDFRTALREEFPGLVASIGDWDRRDVLRCFGASLAIAGLAGCEAKPDGEAVPYVLQPEQEVPGNPRYYTSAVTLAGYAQPVIGTTFEGRPTKLEGNPDHPASLGATDPFTQAAILNLYDPDRSQSVYKAGLPASWRDLDAMLTTQARRLDRTGGAGFRLLTGAHSSPTWGRQIEAMLARWPEARWHVFEPHDNSASLDAAELAFGQRLEQRLHLDRAEVIVALDADPLGPGPAQVWNSKHWARRRQAFQRGEGASHMLVAEPSPTLTGGRAGRRLVAEPDRIPVLVQALAATFGVGGASTPALSPAERSWVEDAAKLLAAYRGRGLLLVGQDQPAAVQALAFAIDARLGNAGSTSDFIPPVIARPQNGGSLDGLIEDMAAGQVSSLVILATNPAYAAPEAARFTAALKKVPTTLHIGTHRDETAIRCGWHAPLAHELESWSDHRAVDGSSLIAQPLVRPFFDVRTASTMLSALMGDPALSDRSAVQQTWATRWGGPDKARWQKALVTGIAEDAPPATPMATTATPSPLPAAKPTALSLLVRPDPTIWDGSFANNPWAQETPKPFTTLTWDNAVLIAPALAKRLTLDNGDMVRIAGNGAEALAPVCVMPGQAPNTVLLHRGYGRRHGGEVARDCGFDANPFVGIKSVTLTPAGDRKRLAFVQMHHALEGHDHVRKTTLDDRTAKQVEPARPSFYPDDHMSDKRPLRSPNWGMAIDLDLCTGCGACVTACVAENNIPMVGREQVAKGREMHWMRVDRYYEGDPADPELHMQPVPCMHCEDAPCEMGCPVNAAVHSPEGVNLQVYNRCIGTRTCSSFCPYKVRRFNWYGYADDAPETEKAQRNPDVTVRARGVMEKCTFCIQRISRARIAAKEAGHPIADGAVKTACQQVCPTGAISFGDITDEKAEVSLRKSRARDYVLLEEANTKPRTSYLARIRKEGGDV